MVASEPESTWCASASGEAVALYSPGAGMAYTTGRAGRTRGCRARDPRARSTSFDLGVTTAKREF